MLRCADFEMYSAPGLLLICSWSAPGLLLVCAWSAPGLLLVCSWSAPGLLLPCLVPAKLVAYVLSYLNPYLSLLC